MNHESKRRTPRGTDWGRILGLLSGLFLGIQSTAAYGVGTSTQDEDKAKTVKAFVQYCQGQTKSSPECEKIRKEAVSILKEDLLTLGSSADKSKSPLLVNVLRSNEAELRAAAADALGMIRPTPAEVPALMKALNDSVPLVRQSVRAALQSKTEPSPAADILIRKANKDKRKDMEPDPIPQEGRLGVTVYSGATYLYYASDLAAGRIAFATSDSVEKVLNFYSAQAKGPSMTADQFNKAYKEKPTGSAQQEMGKAMMERMMKAVQEGKNPQELQAEMLKGFTTELPTREYSDRELYGSPVFLVLEESDLGGMKRPVRFVAVFQDRGLNQTGFVLHIPVEIPVPNAGSGEPRPARSPRRPR